MFIQCFSTKFQLTKIFIVPESTSVQTENISEIHIVSRVIERYRKVLQTLRVLIISFRDNIFFYWEYLVEIIEINKNRQASMSNSSLFLELYFSTSSTVNLFTSS